MPNPVVIGGYVNVANAGPDGRSFASGDVDDVYRMDLIAGQVIELVIPSAGAGGDDADLFLFNSSLELVDSAEGVGQVEQLTVPADGTYFVDVFAFSGAPLYRLSVGQSTVTSNVPGLRLSDEFIPGEVIVTLKSAGDPAAKSAKSGFDPGDPLRHEPEGRRAGARDAAQAAGRHGTVTSGMTPWSRGAGLERRCHTGAATAATPRWRVASAAQQRKLDTILYAKRLRSDPDVRFADLNRVMRTSAVPNDPGYPIQRWHYEQIQLPGAWDITTGRPRSASPSSTPA